MSIKPEKIIYVCFMIVFAALTNSVSAVQLHNWREPLFLIAAEMERTESSPSGMFWDDIRTADIFDRTIWPEKEILGSNYFFLEPSATGAFGPVAEDKDDDFYWKIGMLNQIRYRNLLIRQTLDVDKRYQYDSLYPAHRKRDVRGRIGEAFLQVDWKYGFFRLGRLNRNWGPFADRSLVLSSNPYSYDALEWQLHSSLFEFRHLFAPFHYERLNHRDTDDNSNVNRFFTAHSLNLMLGKWVTLGITESVLFTRKSDFPDLQYINPFSIYTVVNTNQEGKGNLMLSFQWNIHPLTEDISFRGQVAFDDFQVDDEVASDKEPTHWGLDMGLFWRNPFSITFPHLLKAQYNYRSPWLYTVTDNNANNGERYIYWGKSLGFQQNDGDRVSGGFSIAGDNYWAAEVELAFCREGGRDVLTRWNDNETGNTRGLPSDSSYTTQKAFEFNLKSIVYFKDYADLALKGSSMWVKNRDNIKGSDFEFIPSIQAELSIHFSDFKLRLP